MEPWKEPGTSHRVVGGAGHVSEGRNQTGGKHEVVERNRITVGQANGPPGPVDADDVSDAACGPRASADDRSDGPGDLLRRDEAGGDLEQQGREGRVVVSVDQLHRSWGRAQRANRREPRHARTDDDDPRGCLHHTCPVRSFAVSSWGILEEMKQRSAAKRRFLPGSPFNNIEPTQTIETFAVQDRVTHDTYGLGRVVGAEAEAVTVDFGSHQLRIVSPFHKLTKL